MNLSRSLRDPKQSRPALAAILLVAGISLSCSTACLTMAAVGTVQDAMRPTVLDAAKNQLRQNIRAHGGARSPAITADPESLRQALLAALPEPDHSFAAELGVAIESSVDAKTGTEAWRITAWGNFEPYYADAFARYAEGLRRKQAKPPAIHLLIQHQHPAGRSKVIEYDFK